MLAQVTIPLIVLLGVLVLGLIFLRKMPLGILLALAAIIATISAGMGIPIRHIVEGTFVYLNVILVCITGMIFLQVLEDSGSSIVMSRSIVSRLYTRPILLLFTVMLLLLVPSMLTGVAVTTVLSTGVLVTPILVGMGVPATTVGTIVAIGAILGMIAPPTNLLAMILAQGINAPYEGFGLPCFLLSVPPAIVIGICLAWPHIRRKEKPSLSDILETLPKVNWDNKSPFLAWLPLIIVIGLMTIIRIFPSVIPDLGTPLVFMLGAIAALFTGQKVNVFKATQKALSGPMLTVIEVLVGVGIFVQLATLTGVRGLLVVGSLALPNVWAYVAAAVALVLGSGLLSPFGSASIIGVPFALYFMGKNQIIVMSALSLIASVGQLAPPTAIVGRLTAEIGNIEYRSLVKKAFPWAVVLVLICVVSVIYADQIATFLL